MMTTTMKPLQRAAVICRLADQLREAGSWCGETHLQKATFLLEDARGVPLDHEFILYRYGPFSFDLRDELEGLRARGFLRLQPQQYPYGPRLEVTGRGLRLLEHFPKTLDRHADEMDEVVDFVGSRGVSALERLATAVYLVHREPDTSDTELAEKLRDVKPHVSPEAASDAVARARDFLAG